MKSIYDFIVKPAGERYSNKIKINDKELILNTNIENWKAVNRIAVVVETPLAFSTKIKKDDLVVVHQNVFRRFYDIKGKQKDSRSWFKEDLYFCNISQLYLYKQKNKWQTILERCFVKPIVDTNDFTLDKEKKLVGILKYGNSSLEASGINPGDLIGFTPNSEWDFIIDNERLFCMQSNDIVIKYEFQGNEVEYNPSWAKSC